MKKNWYTVQVSAKLNDEDIETLENSLCDMFKEQFGIYAVALDIAEEDDQDDEDDEDEE